jgi:(S)-2-hydroxy-acid oxidase
MSKTTDSSGPVSVEFSQAELSRRKFVRFLAGTSLAGVLPANILAAAEGNGPVTDAGLAECVAAIPDVPPITSPGDAYNIFDLKAVAKQNIPPAHWGYLETGVNGDVTLRANEEGYLDWNILPRRMVDVSRVNTLIKLFGQYYPPVIMSPVASQAGFHPDGELASARAARNSNNLQCLSSLSSYAIEDVVRERGAPVWFQCYPTSDWDVTQFIVERAERAGSPVLLLTVDNLARRSDTQQYYARLDDRDCSSCHQGRSWRDKPLFDGSPVSRSTRFLTPRNWDWEYIERLRGITDMEIIMKGIVTAKDAQNCLDAAVDGVVVSNHGGRGEESGRASINSLPEVANVLKGHMPILFDGGIRRGADIFKAYALGADGVCVGRPYVYGLGAFGQEGVEAALRVLLYDFYTTMVQAGVARVDEIDDSFVMPNWHPELPNS